MSRLDKISRMMLATLLIAVLISCSDDSTAPDDKKPSTPQICRRVPLPPPTNNVITVSSPAELAGAVQQANAAGNTTIMLEDGTYRLDIALYISADNVTIRSRSGNRDAVIVRGQGMGGVFTFTTAILMSGNGFVLADLTIGWTVDHAVELVGAVDNPLFHNVRFIDTGNDMLRISPAPVDSARSDGGIVEWCSFEYTAGSGPDDSVGGIIAQKCRNWTIKNNVFKNICSPDANPAFHAVLFFRSSGTLVDNNTFVNCDKGIGFGLGLEADSHSGGLIKNNTVHTVGEVSIGLESADNASVYNNTIYTENYVNSIEYRWAGTVNASIINNLTNAAIASRDAGTGIAENNVVNAQLSWFVDILNGDGHLALAPSSVVDRGQALPAVTLDIDCETRPRGAGYDIGADER